MRDLDIVDGSTVDGTGAASLVDEVLMSESVTANYAEPQEGSARREFLS